MVKIIKNNEEYNAALSEIDRLLDIDPDPGTEDADYLELLIVLVERYESERPGSIPTLDPIEAIRFRMEQQNLTQRDLVPYFGSRSKVSEVLSRKRPLTLQMIRALNSGLGIPAKSLLQDSDLSLLSESSIDWGRFPIREMVKLGWIGQDIRNVKDNAEEIMRQFLAKLGPIRDVALECRMTENVRAAREMDEFALIAWTARVIQRANEMELPTEYEDGTVNPEFMHTLARQSWSNSGPLLAREYLAKHGIALVVERHLSKTRLDGAAIIVSKNRPIIALTIRYDRIDNFWFTLMHELAHVALHLRNEPMGFYDDLESEDQGVRHEREADELAGEALIPEEDWNDSLASGLRPPEAAEELASRLGIHPAIVAGRMRREFRAYRLLNNLVGHRKVRILFPEVNWG